MKLENTFPQFCSVECRLFFVLSGFLLLWTDLGCVPDVIVLLWFLPDEAKLQQFSKNNSTSSSFLLRIKPFPEGNIDASFLFVCTVSIRKHQYRIPSKCLMGFLVCFYSCSTFDLQLLQQTVVLIIVVS